VLRLMREVEEGGSRVEGPCEYWRKALSLVKSRSALQYIRE
jgi:hypothetical protein